MPMKPRTPPTIAPALFAARNIVGVTVLPMPAAISRNEMFSSRHLRVQPKRKAGQGGRGGNEHPLAEVEAFEARTDGADAAVGGGPLDGVTAFAARMRDDLADEIGSNGQ